MVELANFFKITADLMCVLDEKGLCLAVNLAFEQLLNRSSDRVVGLLPILKPVTHLSTLQRLCLR